MSEMMRSFKISSACGRLIAELELMDILKVKGMARSYVARLRNVLVILHSKASVAFRDVEAILHYPVILAMFGFDAVVVLPSAIIVGTTVIGGLTGVIAAVVVSQLPVEILVYRKIKDEDSKAKLMSEAWESRKTTSQLVEEYEELLKKK